MGEVGATGVRRSIKRLRRADAAVVYVGTGATVGGLLLAVVGWALFAVSEGQPPGSDAYWAYREAAVVVAGIATLTILVGGIRLATVVGRIRRRTLAAAALGTACCLASLAVFVTAYPMAWNVPGPDRSLLGVSLYGVGVVALGFAVALAVRGRYPPT